MARPRKQDNIEPWLKGLLSAGRRRADEVLSAGKQYQYSERSLRRVKAELGIVSEQEGEVWYWRDPSVEQPEAASEDKLDVLSHKVDELTRLSQPAVPVDHEPGVILSDKFRRALDSGKAKIIDYSAPETIAGFERQKQAYERSQAVQQVANSVDPFALLETANLDEIEQMLGLVRNHVFELESAKKTDDLDQWTRWIEQANQRVKAFYA